MIGKTKSLGRWLFLILGLTFVACSQTTPPPASTTRTKLTDASSPRAMLQSLAAQYRAAKTYADTGEIVVETEIDGQRETSAAIPFSIAFSRPNKLRLQAFDATVVADGDIIRSTLGKMPDQVLVNPIQDRLHYEDIFSDELLTGVVHGGMDIILPPLVLLLDSDPVDDLLRGATDLAWEENFELNGEECRCIRATGPKGCAKFWISKGTGLLQRIEFPTAAIQRESNVALSDLKVTATFHHARVNQPIPGEAFVLQPPAGAVLVKRFLPELSSVMQKLAQEESLSTDEERNFRLQLDALQQRFEKDIIGMQAPVDAPAAELSARPSQPQPDTDDRAE